MAEAAEAVVPPSIRMASCFFMPALNHSSGRAATMVPCQLGKVAAMVQDNTFLVRLNNALQFAGVKKADLARVLKISPQAINKLYAGTSKTMAARNAARTAEHLGVDLHWLSTGEGGPAVKPAEGGNGESAQAHWLSQARPIMAPPNLP